MFAKKMIPQTNFGSQNWSPRTDLAAKIGPPLMYTRMHGRTESGKIDLLSGQKQSLM